MRGIGAPSVQAITARSARRGPSCAVSCRVPNSARSIALPASAPIKRPAMAPAGPNTALPAAAPAAERTSAAISQSLQEIEMRMRAACATTAQGRLPQRLRRHVRAPSCQPLSRSPHAWPANVRANGTTTRRLARSSPAELLRDDVRQRQQATPRPSIPPSRERKAAPAPAPRRLQRARRRARDQDSRSPGPATRPGDNKACRSSAASPRRYRFGEQTCLLTACAVVAGLARERMRDDEVITGVVRESPEIHSVVKASPADLKLLVAAGRDDERVPDRDRLWHRLPQNKAYGTAFAVTFHLDAQTAIGPTAECKFSGREPAISETAEAACGECRGCVRRGDGSSAAESGVAEINPAAAVAEIGRARRREQAAAFLRQPVAQSPHLRGERQAFPPHFAERSFCKQYAQLGLAPVDQPNFNRGFVIAAGRKIRFAECVIGERARQFGRIDSQPELLRYFAAGEAAARAACDRIERDVFIMVGESLRNAIGALDHPAAAKRGDTGVEFRLQRGWNCTHLESLRRHPETAPENKRVVGDSTPVRRRQWPHKAVLHQLHLF